MRPDQPGSGAPDSQLLHAEVSGAVLRAFYKTYNVLGYGFLESVYRRALLVELTTHGVSAEAEVPVKVFYREKEIGHFRLDILVEGKVAVELKSGMTLGPTDQHQLTNYLRAGRLDVGLLLHYGPDPKFHRLLNPTSFRS